MRRPKSTSRRDEFRLGLTGATCDRSSAAQKSELHGWWRRYPSWRQGPASRRIHDGGLDESTDRGHAPGNRCRAGGPLRDLAGARVHGNRQFHVPRRGGLLPDRAVGPDHLGTPPRGDLVLGRSRVLERPCLRVELRHLHLDLHADLRLHVAAVRLDDGVRDRRLVPGPGDLLLPELPGCPGALRQDGIGDAHTRAACRL